MNAAMARIIAQQIPHAQTRSVRMSASALMDSLEMDSIVQVSSVIVTNNRRISAVCICFKQSCSTRVFSRDL